MELGPVLTFAGVAATALITGAVTFYTTRSKAKTDLQASLIAGFGAMTDQLQEDRKELQAEAKEAAKEISALREQLHTKNSSIEELRVDIYYATLHIRALEHLLTTHKVDIPLQLKRI